MGKLERDYQRRLIQKLHRMFPDAIVLKNDSEYLPGIPDLIILNGPQWATLEVKRSERDRNNPEPNQEWYVDLMDQMSFSAFIYPENEEEVLDAIQRAFEPRRATRISKRK